jgi:hypothetical protein
MNDPLSQRIGIRKKIDWTTFDTAFPRTKKYEHRAAYEVDIPNLSQTPLAPDARHLSGDAYHVPEDYVALLNGALFSSTNSVILSPDRDVISESSNCGQLRYLFKREMYTSRPTPLKVKGLATPLRSRYHNFYHFFVDCLPRLAALVQSTAVSDETVTLLCTTPPSSLERLLLDRLGGDRFEIALLAQNALYEVETLAFTPLKTRRMSGYLPAPYGETLRSLLAPDRPSRRDRRLLISRREASYRRIGNEAALLDALRPLGFEAVALETLPLTEQAALLHDADAVVAPHGAGLTNLLYAQNAAVVELFPNPVVTPHYLLLAASLGHRYRYWCGQSDDLYVTDFDVNVNAVRTRLHELGIS